MVLLQYVSQSLCVYLREREQGAEKARDINKIEEASDNNNRKLFNNQMHGLSWDLTEKCWLIIHAA